MNSLIEAYLVQFALQMCIGESAVRAYSLNGFWRF